MTRRTHLGAYASAALPFLWAVKRARCLTNADVARGIGTSDAMAAKLLFGDRRAGRDLSVACRNAFGVPIELWSVPVPSDWTIPGDDEAAA